MNLNKIKGRKKFFSSKNYIYKKDLKCILKRLLRDCCDAMLQNHLNLFLEITM